MTLDMLLETKNERFWFKTKLKVAKYKFEQEEYEDLEKVQKQKLFWINFLINLFFLCRLFVN